MRAGGTLIVADRLCRTSTRLPESLERVRVSAALLACATDRILEPAADRRITRSAS